MTTKVTIETHDWPVRVSTFPVVDGQPAPQGEYQQHSEVPPHSTHVVYPHSGADFLLQELPAPAVEKAEG